MNESRFTKFLVYGFITAIIGLAALVVFGVVEYTTTFFGLKSVWAGVAGYLATSIPLTIYAPYKPVSLSTKPFAQRIAFMFLLVGIAVGSSMLLGKLFSMLTQTYPAWATYLDHARLFTFGFLYGCWPRAITRLAAYINT